MSREFKGGTKVLFFIDKGGEWRERTIANTITARENRGISIRHMEGTAVMISISSDLVKKQTPNFRGGQIVVVGTVDPKRHSQMDIYHPSGIMSCLDALKEHKKIMEKVKVKEATKSGYAECRIGGGGHGEFDGP